MQELFNTGLMRAGNLIDDMQMHSSSGLPKQNFYQHAGACV